jgi:hypothetical protein
MDFNDIVILDCYSDNAKKDFINLGVNLPEWVLDLKMFIDNYKYTNTYLITLNINIAARRRHTSAFLSTYTKFLINYPDFERSKFYIKELETLIRLTDITFNHARVLFSEVGFTDFSNTYLPIKNIDEIKEFMAKADIYNKL